MLGNILSSKAPLMVVMRYILLAAIIFMGILRLRYLILYLSYSNTYIDRDILQAYLMAKSLVNGINPYLPLNDLMHRFIGNITYLPHPAPYPPFVALFSLPLLLFNVNGMVIAWFVFELVCLAATAGMLTILWKGRIDRVQALLVFFILLAWFPVMIELSWGQFSLLLTALLLATLLALKESRQNLAGVLLGLTLALKLITWPLLIYLMLKKDWRTVIVSGVTAVGLNLAALAAMGIGPFMDYYLHVSTQVLEAWRSYIYNFSFWSIGYRLFAGTGSPILIDPLNVPALINLPWAAPVVSFAITSLFLLAGLRWAVQSKQIEAAFAIMMCVIIAVSPLSWHHSFVMLIITVAVMMQMMVNQSYSTKLTLFFIGIVLLLFLFNEQIAAFTLSLNGGKEIVLARGIGITYISSLLFWVPMLELAGMAILLWRMVVKKGQVEAAVNFHPPSETLSTNSD